MHAKSWILSTSVMGSLALAAAALGIAQSPAAHHPVAAASTATSTAHPMIPAPSLVPPTATTTTTAPPPTTTTTTAPAVAATAEASTAQATQVLVYDPYTATGALAPTVVVTQQRTAKACVSNGVAGQGSYRCFTTPQPTAQQSDIYDPCFPAPGATAGPVVCPTGGPGPSAVEVSVGTLPPVTTVGPATRPWALELANGQMCTLVNAAWGGLGPFACEHAAQPGPIADCHVPVEQTPTWTVACQTNGTTAAPFETYPVTTAWT